MKKFVLKRKRNKISLWKGIFLFWVVSNLLLPPLTLGESNFSQIYSSPTAGYKNILVKEIISADSLKLENDERIKLIGLKAPEPPEKEKVIRDEYGLVIKKAASPLISLEEQALTFAEKLLKGKKVRLEFDVERNSHEGTYAYVFLLEDELFVNAEILRQGYALLQIQPPNTKYEHPLREAYHEARHEKKGIHSQ